jgi:hypothetical protein
MGGKVNGMALVQWVHFHMRREWREGVRYIGVGADCSTQDLEATRLDRRSRDAQSG